MYIEFKLTKVNNHLQHIFLWFYEDFKASLNHFLIHFFIYDVKVLFL